MVQSYGLPHECEREELAALLGRLTSQQRRAVRSFVWQVEMGSQSVTAWLASDVCPVSHASWYRGNGRLWCNPEFQRALRAYRTTALQWQTEQERREVLRARTTLLRATPDAAGRLVEQSQGDMGAFFKVVERWTPDPLLSQEIIGERKVEVEDGKMETEYLARAVVVDVERLRDPRYSRLVKKFSDSPRAGLAIELYDALHAAESILDRADLETAAKTPAVVAQGGQVDVRLNVLAEVPDDELDQLIANLQAATGGGAVGEGAEGSATRGQRSEETA
jgi:hypothetical protein